MTVVMEEMFTIYLLVLEADAAFSEWLDFRDHGDEVVGGQGGDLDRDGFFCLS